MKAKILVVEDEQSLNEVYEQILKKANFTVQVAFNGQEALDKLKTYEPDLILLDLRMPHVNGIEFLKQYQLKENHPNVKVIVFSNLDVQKEIDAAYQLGAVRYMLKAWASPKEFIKLVNDTLKS